MKTPQVAPNWATGIYLGGGVVATPKTHGLYQGKVSKVSRLQNSYNGNPRYAVWVEGLGRFSTSTDAGWVYGVNWSDLKGRTVLLEVSQRENSRTIQSIDIEG